MPDIIPVAVVGVGAFGRNHARVYHELEQQGDPVRLVGVVDANPERADAVAKEFNCRAFGCIEQLASTHSEVQAASVAVPTIHHLATARALMQAGVDVLIEKPLATSLAEADELIAQAKKSGRIAQTGHLERFNPAVQATVPLITKPMFFEVHRLSVFNPRSLDVDVVLDLMIHDLDAVLSFVNSPVAEIHAVGMPILSTKVDIANARIEFEVRVRGKFHRQPGLDRARPQDALLSAAPIYFHRLRQAGFAGVHRGRRSRRSAVGQSEHQGFQAADCARRTSAGGDPVVPRFGPQAADAGDSPGRRPPCARHSAGSERPDC